MEQTAPITATMPQVWRVPQMRPYRNIEGGLGVVAFAIGDDHISVRMHTGRTLCFTCRSAGRAYVEHMKLLALAGDGLNRFIFKEARDMHEPTVAP